MKEKIKIYYSPKKIDELFQKFIRKLFVAQDLEEATQIFLDLESCISPRYRAHMFEKKVMTENGLVPFRELPIVKAVNLAKKKYIIASYDVIMGYEKENNQITWLIGKKKVILSNALTAIDDFKEKKDKYEKINTAIIKGNKEALENEYDFLSKETCYSWVIDSFDLEPMVLKRALENKTEENSN